MIYRNKCPVCGSEERKKISDRGFKFTEESVYFCLDCSVCYLDPYIDDLTEFYRSNEFSKEFRGNERPSAEKVRENYVRALDRWLLLRPALDKYSSLLEIGCSSGEFLDLASNSIVEVHGVDLSTSFAELAIDKGHDIQIAAFPDEYKNDSWIDVVVTFHTLEHIPDPHTFIERVREILPADGLLVIELPDLYVALTRRRNTFDPNTYFQKSHVIDFNLNALIVFLSGKGFTFVNSATYKDYPKDKNVLAIFQKTSDTDVEPQYDREVFEAAKKDMQDMFEKYL